MGQTTSVTITHPNQEQNALFKSANSVTFKELLKFIDELNAVTSGFTDKTGSHLKFDIKKGTEHSFLWKSRVRILCLKLNINTNEMESSRILTLRQFVNLHREIMVQVSALSRHYQELFASKKPALQGKRSSQGREAQVSARATSLKKRASPYEQKVPECCVCMERRACIMLSCCHEFCEVCIDNWTRDEEHSNCPLCRKSADGADKTWVVTKETADYSCEIKNYLMGVADRAGDP